MLLLMFSGLTTPKQAERDSNLIGMSNTVIASIDANAQPSVVGNTTQRISEHFDVQNAYHALEVTKKDFLSQVEENLKECGTWEQFACQATTSVDESEKIKSILDKMSAAQGIPLPTDALYQVEGLIALYFAISKSVDTVQAVAIISLYLQRFYSKSVVELVLDAIADASIENQAIEKPNWLALLKSAQTNWKLVIANEGFSHLSNVLSIMLGLGLCDSSSMEFNVAGMKLFNIAAQKKQACAITLVDAIFSTITYFVEGGFECFRQGSIKPLLYGDLDMQQLEKDLSLCEQYGEFAKTGDLQKRANMSNNDFDSMLRSIIEKLEVMAKITKSPIAERMLRDKLDKVRRIQTYFMQTRVQGGLREAPYGLGAYGGTGVGKSSVGNILMVCVLMHNGYNASDDVLVTLNDFDKFMSNYRSNTNGVFLDDEGNTKMEFSEKAPSARKIELINNVRMYANMAEAELKGKVSVEPKVVVSTKNPKDGLANTTSNEPASVTRREQFLATVKVKQEFATKGMLDTKKVQAFYNQEIPMIPDLWELTLEKSFPINNPTPGRAALIGWEVIEWEGRKMQDVSIFDVIKYACADSKQYFANQSQLVENSTNLAKKLDFCDTCSFPACMCSCPVDALKLEDQAGALIAPFALSTFTRYRRTANKFFDRYMSELESRTLSEMTDRITWLETSRWMCWTNYVPTKYLDNDHFYAAMLAYNSDELKTKLAAAYCGCFMTLAFVLAFAYMYGAWLVLFAAVPLYKAATVVEVEKARLYARVKENNQAMPVIFSKYRDGFIAYITGACVLVSFLYLIAQTREMIKFIPEAQGNLAPTSIDEIEERDAEQDLHEIIAKEQNWVNATVEPIPCATVCKTCTPQQLVRMVTRNLTQFTFMHNGKKHGCDMFFVESNIAVIPRHIWVQDEITAIVAGGDLSNTSTTFKCRLSRTYSVDIPDTDLCVVYVPNGGSWKNLSDYLPSAMFRSVPANFVYKHITAEGKLRLMSCSTHLEMGRVGNAERRFDGASYKLDFNTFVGMCMGTLVTDTREAVIAGFHLGGMTGSPMATCGILIKSKYLNAKYELGEIPGVSLAASQGTLKTELFDKQFFTGTDLHPKSPVLNLPEGAHLEVYGTCTGRATYYSAVQPTIICEDVEEVCDYQNQHGPPKFHLGKAWKESLNVSCNPSIGVEGNLLARAVDDYLDPMLKRFEEIEGFSVLKSYIRPLTEMENVCGIDGIRFIDKLAPNTSIGFPLSGAKSKFIERLDPDEFEGVACPAVLEPRFWQEYYSMEEEYLADRRCHVVFKACLKDEPTKLSKDKVRVFQAAPITLQLGIRKYFLPLARILSLLPLESECGVGINTNGPEWDQLVKHMRKHGEDRILAGDYSKYDLRMPAQLTMAAFDVLIRMAVHYGYSDRSIKIMRGLATDVCYPVMAYNGDLLQHFGSNPSGQNLTVYINSIVNSLLLRCAYFKIFEERDVPEYREVASMMTYGDDVKGSVKEGFDEYNHISYTEFLAERDIVFTMPDKESTPTKYMLDSDADFLKRKNVWNEELQLWMGALDEASIFKSLTSVLESKVLSPKEQAAENIDGALRDWFYYGPEIYEQRRAQMAEVALRNNLTHSCKMLDVTYQMSMDKFKERYADEL